jgi:hypothetical protein
VQRIYEQLHGLYTPFLEPITTRKLTKTNRIIDVIFSSVIFTDGNNFVSNFVGIYRQSISVYDTVGIYRQMYSVGIYQQMYSIGIYRPYCRWIIQFFVKLKRCDDVDFFRWFYRRNDQGIQTGISVQWRGTVTNELTNGYTNGNFPLVIPSVKANVYPLYRLSHPLFSFFFPIPTLPLFSTQALKLTFQCHF